MSSTRGVDWQVSSSPTKDQAEFSNDTDSLLAMHIGHLRELRVTDANMKLMLASLL